jgi:hypothetical protein
MDPSREVHVACKVVVFSVCNFILHPNDSPQHGWSWTVPTAQHSAPTDLCWTKTRANKTGLTNKNQTLAQPLTPLAQEETTGEKLATWHTNCTWLSEPINESTHKIVERIKAHKNFTINGIGMKSTKRGN